MEQSSHVRKVEKAMKEALKNDRARIQVGRISSFGLMEMSRQRLRTGVLEASTKPCPHCDGTGLMRTAASAGLSALRILEDEAARGRGERICLRAGKEAAVYVLNKKRSELADIEQRYGVMIEIIIDESFEGARMTVDSSGPRPVAQPRPAAIAVEEEDEAESEMIEDEEEEEEDEGREAREPQSEDERSGRRRRRRRRGGRGRGRREGGEPVETAEAVAFDADEGQPVETAEEAPAEPATAEPREGGRRRRRRRGRGGGAPEAQEAVVEPESSPMVERPVDEEQPIAETAPADEPAAPAKRGRRKKTAVETEVTVSEPGPAEAPSAEIVDEAAPAKKPARKGRSKKAQAEPAPTAEPVPVPAANNDMADETSDEPRRSGWWQRTFG
jgi:ribonuclease E